MNPEAWASALAEAQRHRALPVRAPPRGDMLACTFVTCQDVCWKHICMLMIWIFDIFRRLYFRYDMFVLLAMMGRAVKKD